jgi:hypothetical protein
MSKLEQYPGLAKATAISLARRAERRLAAPPVAKRKRGRPTLTVEAKEKTRIGLRALKTKIQLRGLDVISKNTIAGRLLFEWQTGLIAALGGADNISPQQKCLIDLACQSKAICDHVTAFIMEQESLVIKRRKTVIPVVMQRAQLAAQLEKTLTTLGLQRIAKQLPRLQSSELDDLERLHQERVESETQTEVLDVEQPSDEAEG